MRNIEKHIIHCSDSTHGDVRTIRNWHKERGWRDVGYHFIILPDGEIEIGRHMNEIGAHVKGRNRTSLGTCLIGKSEFTSAQFNSLKRLHASLQAQFPAITAHGHREFSAYKTCPNFEVSDVLK